jgi:hypothetical protein
MFLHGWGVLSKQIEAFVTLNPELAQKSAQKFFSLKEEIEVQKEFRVNLSWKLLHCSIELSDGSHQNKPILRRTSQAIRSFWVDLMELSKLAISRAAKSRNVEALLVVLIVYLQIGVQSIRNPRVFLLPVIPSGDQARTHYLPSITRKRNKAFTLCNALGLGCYPKPNVVGYMSHLLSMCIWPAAIYTLNLEVMRLALLHHNNLKFTYWD